MKYLSIVKREIIVWVPEIDQVNLITPDVTIFPELYIYSFSKVFMKWQNFFPTTGYKITSPDVSNKIQHPLAIDGIC